MDEWPFEIIHHGGAEGVTGSCHQLSVGPDSLLVDCGLFQGSEAGGDGAGADELTVRFDIARLRALVVTHCHIDHIGRIPYLLAAGYDGPILCSEPTARLLPVMLADALRIGFTRDARLIERVLELIASRCVALPYDQWHAVPTEGGSELSVRLRPAGHILGSAYVQCRIGVGKGHHDVVFSGDLGAPHSPLLAAPESPYRADLLVLESTYGDRLHEDRAGRRQRLRTVLERCLADRGVVLIPAFSIGRTQELLYEIEQILHGLSGQGAGPWSEVEVIVDSPLAANFTALYRKLKHFWDREAQQRVENGRHPLSFQQLTVVEEHEQHQRLVAALRRRRHPCIVIAGGGMCTGGRIVNYLKALLADPTTDVLFVGYQASGTPGRVLQRHGRRRGYVSLEGKRYTIRAGVHTIAGYSAHADQADLLRFVTGMREHPREIRLVHGDYAARQSLQMKLEEVLPGTRVVLGSVDGGQ